MPKKSDKADYAGLETKATFIRNLKEDGGNVWSEFYDNYSRLILNFARKRGCSPELAEDVLQEVAMALFKYLPGFKYDKDKGGFRSLLFKITESKVVDAFRRTSQLNMLRGSEIFGDESDEGEAARASLLWDSAWEESVLSRAIDMAKGRVQGRTFECFENVFLKGESVRAAAADMGISPNLVSQHKHKVFKMVVEIAKKLMSDNN